MKASNEFVKGKNQIGWVSDFFNENFKNVEFKARVMPKFQKLPRNMKDVEIESELKPDISELGDVLTFIDNAPDECKDDNWNVFYLPSFVVGVCWDDDEWVVDAWSRGGSDWGAGYRVFSPAIDPSKPSDLGSLQLRLSELESWKKKVEKILNI